MSRAGHPAPFPLFSVRDRNDYDADMHSRNRMSPRWLPLAALLGIVLFSAGASAHHCFGGDGGNDLTAQSVSTPPPPVLLVAFVLIPVVAAGLAIAGGVVRRPKAPEGGGEWVATPEQWVFVPRQK